MKAFPSISKEPMDDGEGCFYTPFSEGMELRDYFAAKAMQSFINICYKELDVAKDKAGIVESAYELADEMLKERNKNANY